MSCGLAIAAVLAFTDASGAAVEASPPAPAVVVSHLVGEPLYADIIARAQTLERAAVAFRAAPGLKASPHALALPEFQRFKAEAEALAALDMRGHLDLAARGTDGDLKCILKGISEDLPRKIAQVEQAASGAEQDSALDELRYLLNDNAAVILAPPQPPV